MLSLATYFASCLLSLPSNIKMMNIKLKKEEHSPDLLKGKHFLRFILYFSYELKKKISPIFKNFSLSFLRFFIKFLGELLPIQNIPVLLKKFSEISSQLVYKENNSQIFSIYIVLRNIFFQEGKFYPKVTLVKSSRWMVLFYWIIQLTLSSTFWMLLLKLRSVLAMIGYVHFKNW